MQSRAAKIRQTPPLLFGFTGALDFFNAFCLYKMPSLQLQFSQLVPLWRNRQLQHFIYVMHGTWSIVHRVSDIQHAAKIHNCRFIIESPLAVISAPLCEITSSHAREAYVLPAIDFCIKSSYPTNQPRCFHQINCKVILQYT